MNTQGSHRAPSLSCLYTILCVHVRHPKNTNVSKTSSNILFLRTQDDNLCMMYATVRTPLPITRWMMQLSNEGLDKFLLSDCFFLP